MEVDSVRGVSLADRALRQLQRWPSLTTCHTGSVPGRGLAADARQIVHLHRVDEAEVQLTRPVIDRMHEALDGCGRVQVDPGSEWVRVRLDGDSDVTLLMALVSVAIQANAVVSWERTGYCACPAVRQHRSW